MSAGGADPLLQRSIGNYRVVGLIGAGGMGRVYRAEHPGIGARVAIKVMAQHGDELSADAVERFLAEARAVNLIRHENIVNVLDLGRLAEGTPFIVMEHLDGASLGERLRSQGPLPPALVIEVARQVLSALAAAHARGIVHRDLKPDNVFLTPGGQVKVLDFGLAKLLPDAALARGNATRSSALLGTPPYLAPEQLLGGGIDARTDLWALGVTMYEVLCGRRPFESKLMFDLFEQITAKAPAPLGPGVPPALEAVIMRALAKQPSARFASAQDMARALERPARAPLAATEPQAAPLAPAPAPAPPQSQSPPPARWRAVLAVGLLLVAGAALVLALWWPRARRGRPALAAAAVDGGVAVVDAAPLPAPVASVVLPQPSSPAPSPRRPRAGAPGPGARPSAPPASAGAAVVAPATTPAPAPAASPAPAGSPRPWDPWPSPPDPPPAAAVSPSPSKPAEEQIDEKRLNQGVLLPPLKPPLRFDATTRISEVRALARRYFPDAYLAGLRAWTDRNGLTDLADNFINYEFYSPARADRADHHCWLTLSVTDRSIAVNAKDGRTCGRPPQGPRCSAARIRAAAMPLIDEDIATVIYQYGKWEVEHGNSTSGKLPDDC